MRWCVEVWGRFWILFPADLKTSCFTFAFLQEATPHCVQRPHTHIHTPFQSHVQINMSTYNQMHSTLHNIHFSHCMFEWICAFCHTVLLHLKCFIALNFHSVLSDCQYFHTYTIYYNDFRHPFVSRSKMKHF